VIPFFLPSGLYHLFLFIFLIAQARKFSTALDRSSDVNTLLEFLTLKEVIFFFFEVLGFELRASYLLGKHSAA
jgi:hypothetical protein